MNRMADGTPRLTCYCCDSPLVRAGDKPDVRWMRHGDRYCVACDDVVPREQLVDGWPAGPWPCPRHRRAPKGGA